MECKTILIVDDDANIRTSLRVCLEQDGYIVEQASDGKEALELIRRDETPRLVLLDLAMPGMDGMTLLAQIRPLVPQRIRVVVITAHGSAKTAIAAIRMGASDFLQKPLTPPDIRQSIASVLNDLPPTANLTPGSYADVLQHVRQALRAGEFASAEAGLMQAGSIMDQDPQFLNLAGILHESHGRLTSARHFYERAASANPGYAAAQENLRRLQDIRRHGKTQRKVAFGDDDCLQTAGPEKGAL
jgi:CheY-like chemotaxis protein